MAYTTIKKPSDYFNTKLYTGNGSTNNITGVGFQPDWVWLKDRDSTEWHNLFDVVRGITANRLYTNSTTVTDGYDSNALQSFDSDGFTLGSGGAYNNSGNNFVSWNWLAGTTSGLSGGTITPSSYSINATSGFGIYKYTGNSTSGATIAHGLGKVPTMIMVKRLDSPKEWQIYHTAMGNGKWIELTTGTPQTGISRWNNTSPTNTLFYLGNDSDVNNSAGTYLAYVFCDVTGYSKFGSYTGNGNTDGTFVYTGFKPAFVMTKETSDTSSWGMWDNKRLGYNPDQKRIQAEDSAAESSTGSLDLLSNGFKLTSASGSLNTSGNTFIYMAFAEEPLVGDNPATAR